ncbi:MAG: hypothetical protein WCH86_02435 [Kiritimatiellales bacterium]
MILAAGAALLLLTGLIMFQDVRRQNMVNSKRFAEQYERVIQQLRGNMDSVQKKMRRNEVMTSVVVEVSREPTPGMKVAEKNRAFVLQGISWSADRPLVMIDDKLYKAGDSIGGYTIQQISPQAIILRDADGAQQKITLIKEVRP